MIMAKITNKQLISYVKTMLGHPYWYGCFGQISTKKLYNSKKAQYPDMYKWECPSSQLNKRVFDCVGLIKGAIWSGANPDTTPKYTKSQDVSADGMYNKATVKGKIADIPDVKGLIVYKKGHVGVYIGDGKVIEAKGHAYGVVKTALKGSYWTNYFYCPFITYVTDEKKSDNKKENNKTYTAPKVLIGHNYKLTANRGIYKGCGAVTGRKKISDVTLNAKSNAVNKSAKADAILKKGTVITISATKKSASGNLWVKIPSGWLCVWHCKTNDKFIKEI